MSTMESLKRLNAKGYNSGDILKRSPDSSRRNEERKIRGSYHRFFMEAVRPHLQKSSVVMELGPGRGSWTRAILRYVPQGSVQVVDFLDVRPWLHPEQYNGRLVCHQVEDNSFDSVANGTFDFFFSMGVLCHSTTAMIEEILANALPKMLPGGIAVHQYGDWRKLERLGWTHCGVPPQAKLLPDEHESNIWPRNDPEIMATIASEAGWIVEQADLGFFERDSVIRLRAPAKSSVRLGGRPDPSADLLC